MTYLSPLNAKLMSSKSKISNAVSNKIDSNDLYYQNLIAQSADVRPNKAKAVLVRENFVQAAVSSVKDFINDGKNFFKAAKTGKMDDNSLGRINDFGMKAGALLIATFLASRAKTKTSAIMQYVGGTAFFTSMALWPKIFINLPAKLVHGFRIDQKYISAQGEKKDFFLDNQFLPWDAFSEEELRENAKRTGIDYDSENGDEKIKRKMQKTALQNRTLWMATAGFATPLMTALFGDFVEPKVKDAVIKNGFKRSQKALYNFDKTMANAKPIVRNEKEINTIIKEYNEGLITSSDMMKRLSGMLNLNMNEVFGDIDDLKAITDLKFSVSEDNLNILRHEKSTILTNNLSELLKESFKEKNFDQLFGLSGQSGSAMQTLPDSVINAIVKDFNASQNKNYNTLLGIAKEQAKKAGISVDTIEQTLPKIKFSYDDTEFFKAVRDYNTTVLAQTRGRLEAYLETVLNPIIGSKDESVYTSIYRQAMEKALPPRKRILGILPIYDKETIKAMKAMKTSYKAMKKDGVKLKEFDYIASEEMAKIFQKIASINPDENPKEYKAALEELFVQKDGLINKLLSLALDDENIAKISSINVSENKGLYQVMNSDLSNWISKNIKNFADISNVNIDSIRVKALIGANLERRIKDGSFKDELDSLGMITERMPLEEWIKKARYLVYQGTVAADACLEELKGNESNFINLKNILYDSSKYKVEEQIIPELNGILKGLRELSTTPKDNALVTGLANLQKAFVTDILNNQAWKKIFIPMAIALVGVTLLVQPFFGNIKKEFPDENKGGKN